MRHYFLYFFLTLTIPALSQDTAHSKTKTPAKQTSQVPGGQEALEFHNKIRADKGVPPLQWSADLSKYAQAWADQLAAKGCNLNHTPNAQREVKYGQNIFWQSKQPTTAMDAAKSWYSEIKNYPYSAVGSDGGKSGHYTQMVWKKSKQLGIGIAKCAGGGVIIVADYFPAGNMQGEKPY